MEIPTAFEYTSFPNNADLNFSQDSYDGIYMAGELICTLTLPDLRSGEQRPEKDVYNAILKHPVLAIGITFIAQCERNYCAKLDLELHRDEQIKEMLKRLSNIETSLSQKG